MNPQTHHSTQNRSDLVRWNQGDDSALDDLVRTLYPRLKAIARQLVCHGTMKNQLDPEDLVSLSWPRWRRFNKRDFQDQEKLLVWMQEEMRRALIDEYRSQKRHQRHLSLDEVLSGEKSYDS